MSPASPSILESLLAPVDGGHDDDEDDANDNEDGDDDDGHDDDEMTDSHDAFLLPLPLAHQPLPLGIQRRPGPLAYFIRM